jgi:acyl-CoA thioester hydrolase
MPSDSIAMCKTEFFRNVGLSEDLVSGQFDYQLVKQTIEWKAPARFDQVLELSVLPIALGSTSFTIAVEFRIAGQERIISRAETVYVRVNPKLLTKLPLPPNLQERMDAMPRGTIVDHAGYCST